MAGDPQRRRQARRRSPPRSRQRSWRLTASGRRSSRSSELIRPDFDGRGFRLHYEDHGTGVSVVLLHGYLMDRHLFDAQVERLSSDYRCIVPDRRGHCESDFPFVPGSMSDLVDDVVALIEALGVHPCHLVGMSIRGAEATRIALPYPQRRGGPQDAPRGRFGARRATAEAAGTHP